MPPPTLKLRTYQLPAFLYRGKMLILEFARQTGKSFTLANWAVKRMLEQLSRDEYDEWLIVIISNSKDNGIELGCKITAVLERVKEVERVLARDSEEWGDREIDEYEKRPQYEDVDGIVIENFQQKMTIKLGSKLGRILIRAANPRTARGFAGDLGLDEFAFHEHPHAIWEAAEPIISSNPEYVVRVASTHNGKATLFNRWITDGIYPVASVKRSEAWHMGRGSKSHIDAFRERWQKLDKAACDAWFARTNGEPQPQDRIVIGSLKRTNPDGTPAEVTPEECEQEAGWNAKAYRQNYENDPYDGDNIPFMPWEAITKACCLPMFEPDEQRWGARMLDRVVRLAKGGADMYVGYDFARKGDLSVISVLADSNGTLEHIARLEMRDIDSAAQRQEMQSLIAACGNTLRRVTTDYTGNGTGVTDELASRYGSLILPIHFASTVQLDEFIKTSGDKRVSMYISERMAIDLLKWMEDGKLLLPNDPALKEDMRKPCRVQKGNRILMAAARDNADHADRFWSLALALHGYMEDSRGGWDLQDVQRVEVGATEFDGFFSQW